MYISHIWSAGRLHLTQKEYVLSWNETPPVVEVAAVPAPSVHPEKGFPGISVSESFPSSFLHTEIRR